MFVGARVKTVSIESKFIREREKGYKMSPCLTALSYSAIFLFGDASVYAV